MNSNHPVTFGLGCEEPSGQATAWCEVQHLQPGRQRVSGISLPMQVRERLVELFQLS